MAVQIGTTKNPKGLPGAMGETPTCVKCDKRTYLRQVLTGEPMCYDHLAPPKPVVPFQAYTQGRQSALGDHDES